MEEHILSPFARVRIINLVERSDRRREMLAQIERCGGMRRHIEFFDAKRPTTREEFPNIGARGCFESHLQILKDAIDTSATSLLIMEDDFDFTKRGIESSRQMFAELFEKKWSFFYGSHLLPHRRESGLAEVPSQQPVVTAAFVALHGDVIAPLAEFLQIISSRPAGSPAPNYGPMHVDGAYSVFREMHPEHKTFAAFPPIGSQRSSLSDITPSPFYLDRLRATRGISALLRRARNRIVHR